MNVMKLLFAILAGMCLFAFLLYDFIWLTYSVFGDLSKDEKKRERGLDRSLDYISWSLLFLTILFIILYKIVS